MYAAAKSGGNIGPHGRKGPDPPHPFSHFMPRIWSWIRLHSPFLPPSFLQQTDDLRCLLPSVLAITSLPSIISDGAMTPSFTIPSLLTFHHCIAASLPLMAPPSHFHTAIAVFIHTDHLYDHKSFNFKSSRCPHAPPPRRRRSFL